jgi:hypothetical protein
MATKSEFAAFAASREDDWVVLSQFIQIDVFWVDALIDPRGRF